MTGAWAKHLDSLLSAFEPAARDDLRKAIDIVNDKVAALVAFSVYARVLRGKDQATAEKKFAEARNVLLQEIADLDEFIRGNTKIVN